MGRGVRRGSASSDRQISYAAQEGRTVHVQLSGGNTWFGWIVGVDDYHFVGVDKDDSVSLIHKSSPLITFGSPRRPESGSLAEKMLASFVSYLSQNPANQGEPS